jgi:hypothetical protein
MRSLLTGVAWYGATAAVIIAVPTFIWQWLLILCCLVAVLGGVIHWLAEIWR